MEEIGVRQGRSRWRRGSIFGEQCAPPSTPTTSRRLVVGVDRLVRTVLVEGSQVLSRTDARKWVSEVQLAEIVSKNRSRSWLVSSREIERWRQKAKSLGLLVLGKRLKLHPRKCRRLLASDPAILTTWMMKDPLADVEA